MKLLATAALALAATALTTLITTQARASEIGNAILAGIATHIIVDTIRNSRQPSPVYIPVVTPTGAYHPIIVAPNHDPRVYRPQQQLPTVTRDPCHYSGQTAFVYDHTGRQIGYQICP